jgi:hypothetical protein
MIKMTPIWNATVLETHKLLDPWQTDRQKWTEIERVRLSRTMYISMFINVQLVLLVQYNLLLVKYGLDILNFDHFRNEGPLCGKEGE